MVCEFSFGPWCQNAGVQLREAWSQLCGVGRGYGSHKSMGEHSVKDVWECGQRTWRSSQREATGITEKPAPGLAFPESGTSLSLLFGERRATQRGWVEPSLQLWASGALWKRQTPKLHRPPPHGLRGPEALASLKHMNKLFQLLWDSWN